jgi:hypothetical protein
MGISQRTVHHIDQGLEVGIVSIEFARLNLKILNGNIVANSSSRGSVIGSGGGHLTVLNLTNVIKNITASSSDCGSGIGNVIDEYGNSTVWNLTILNKNITANGICYGSGLTS